MNKQTKIDLLKINTRALGNGEWEVPSYSSAKKYNVTWNGVGGTCTCKGFEYRAWCIHLDVVKEVAPGKPKEAPILDELI